MQCNACCKLKCEKILGAVIPTWSPGDPQTGWMKEGVLEYSGCSFQVDKFQQLSTIQGLICIVLDVGVPKLVAFWIIKGPHLRGET